MDTVTQMLFGATVAQAGFRCRLGRKAMVAGAALGLIPDLDVAVGWIGALSRPGNIIEASPIRFCSLPSRDRSWAG